MQALSLTDRDGTTLAVLHGEAVSAPINGARRELPPEHRADGCVEETFRLLLQGEDIRACLTVLEEILASSRSGFRPAYLTLQDTADSPSVRTPVLDGCLDGLGAGLEDRRRGAQALLLRITRPDWWEEALAGLPLSNLHGTYQTAGLQLDNLDDLTRDNFADIAAADLDGSLPAPARLEFQYATGQTDRLYYTLFAHGTDLSDSGGSLNNVLEGEDAVQGAGVTTWSKIANAQVSAGYYQVMSWTATSEVQLASWTLTSARLAYLRGKFFRPVLRHRLLPNLEDISVRWKIPNAAGSGYALQSGQTRLSTARYISATAALPLPPLNLPAGPYEPVTLELWGECSNSATKTLAIDCIHLLPTEGWLELEPLGGVGALETLVAESEGGYVYRLDATGLRGISHTPIGNFIRLQPGCTNRIYVVFDAANAAANSYYGTLKVSARVRRRDA